MFGFAGLPRFLTVQYIWSSSNIFNPSCALQVSTLNATDMLAILSVPENVLHLSVMIGWTCKQSSGRERAIGKKTDGTYQSDGYYRSAGVQGRKSVCNSIQTITAVKSQSYARESTKQNYWLFLNYATSHSFLITISTRAYVSSSEDFISVLVCIKPIIFNGSDCILLPTIFYLIWCRFLIYVKTYTICIAVVLLGRMPQELCMCVTVKRESRRSRILCGVTTHVIRKPAALQLALLLDQSVPQASSSMKSTHFGFNEVFFFGLLCFRPLQALSCRGVKQSRPKIIPHWIRKKR